MKDLTRRNIRYICFRLQTEAEGGASATPEETGIMSYVDEVKEHLESQAEFGGWKKFAKTWDVDEKAQLVAVNRSSSIQSDWNNVLKKAAKLLPVVKKKQESHEVAAILPTKSAPLRGPGGKFISKKDKLAQTQVLLPPTTNTQGETTEETKDKEKKKGFWKILS